MARRNSVVSNCYPYCNYAASCWAVGFWDRCGLLGRRLEVVEGTSHAGDPRAAQVLVHRAHWEQTPLDRLNKGLRDNLGLPGNERPPAPGVAGGDPAMDRLPGGFV